MDITSTEFSQGQDYDLVGVYLGDGIWFVRGKL